MLATQEREQVDLLEDLKERFTTIGIRWKELRKETGDFLLEAKEQLGDALFKALKKWIAENHQISDSEQSVCIRIAKGEINDELATFIPASTLKNIDVQNMPDMDQKYTIYSPDLGKPVTKKLRDFSKSERQINIGNHGVKNLTEVVHSPKPFQTAIRT